MTGAGSITMTAAASSWAVRTARTAIRAPLAPSSGETITVAATVIAESRGGTTAGETGAGTVVVTAAGKIDRWQDHTNKGTRVLNACGPAPPMRWYSGPLS